jgi:nitrous oxidase accessory protein
MPDAPKIWLTAALVVATGSLAHAANIVVHAGESIQAAIDTAPPGATIVVEPGVYHESGATRAVTVTKDGIRLIGRPRPGKPVVLERVGSQEHGIWVSPADTVGAVDDEEPPCGVSNARLDGFTLRGFTVQGFEAFGVYLACVDHFTLRGNTSRDNGEYALFPVRSSHGRMTDNVGSGTLSDSCIYVGQDDDVVVEHNTATDCQIGLQIENSTHIRFASNVAEGNTAGMIVDILNGRQVKVAADNVVARNVFRENNRPNSAPPGSETADLQPGIGLVVDGADRTKVIRNTISGNALAGVTLVSFCVDRPDACQSPLDIDPYPDGNRFQRNTFDGNGTDFIVLAEQGTGNCARGNRPKSPTFLGPTLPPCQ